MPTTSRNLLGEWPRVYHGSERPLGGRGTVAFAVVCLLAPVVSAALADDPAAGAALLFLVPALVPGALWAYRGGWLPGLVGAGSGLVALVGWDLALSLRGLQPPSGRLALIGAGYIAASACVQGAAHGVRRARRPLNDESLRDALTGLATRQHVEVFLQAAVASADLLGPGVSVVLVSADNFDTLVGIHGRRAGEMVMVALADLLESLVRPPSLPGLLDPGLLAVVLPRGGRDNARELAEKIRREARSLDVPWQPFTVSVGTATLTSPLTPWTRLLQEAESALATGDGRAAVGEPVGGEEPRRVPDDGATGPLAILALPTDERPSVRRVLELSGVRVVEVEDPSSVPMHVQDEARTVVVTAVRTAPDIGDALQQLRNGGSGDAVTLMFVREALDEVELPHERGLTLIRGRPSGDALLPLLTGLLREARSHVSDSVPWVNEGFDSPLSRPDAALTDAQILIVDDEQTSRQALQRALRAIGFHRVHTAASGDAAMEAVVTQPPDLVMLDLQMPGMDGFAVLEALAPLLEGDGFLPVLVVTGDQDPQHRQQVLRSGAKDFLPKPFDVAELGARVLNLLETRRLHLRLPPGEAHPRAPRAPADEGARPGEGRDHLPVGQGGRVPR